MSLPATDATIRWRQTVAPGGAQAGDVKAGNAEAGNAEASRPKAGNVWRAMARGFMGRCPACGRGAIFTGWLRVNGSCAACMAPLGRIRADDAPPYFVIFITAHVVIGAEVAMDSLTNLPALALAGIFVPVALAMCLGLLRPVKGATIGLMLQLGMVSPPDA